MKSLCWVAVLLCQLYASVVLANDRPGTAGDSAELQVATVLQAEHDGRMLLALTRAQSTFERHPQHLLARLTYGRMMVKNGDAAGAIEVLRPLARRAPHDWRVWFWLGSALLLHAELDQAADALDQALVRNGDELAVWIQRAVVEQERQRPEHAEHYLQVAAQMVPEDLNVILNSAYVAERLGRHERAIALYRSFLARSVLRQSHAHLRVDILDRLHALSRYVPGDTSGDNADVAGSVVNPMAATGAVAAEDTQSGDDELF